MCFKMWFAILVAGPIPLGFPTQNINLPGCFPGLYRNLTLPNASSETVTRQAPTTSGIGSHFSPLVISLLIVII